MLNIDCRENLVWTGTAEFMANEVFNPKFPARNQHNLLIIDKNKP